MTGHFPVLFIENTPLVLHVFLDVTAPLNSHFST